MEETKEEKKESKKKKIKKKKKKNEQSYVQLVGQERHRGHKRAKQEGKDTKLKNLNKNTR